MEPKWSLLPKRRLDDVSTRKWIGLGIESFLVISTRFRRAQVSTHSPDDIFVQMAKKSLDHHEDLVSHRRCEGLLEIPAVYELL
jgi:hypothetical protein